MVRGILSRLVLAGLVFGGVLGAQTCTFTLTASTPSFTIAGGTGTVNIVANLSTCVRTTTSNADWITITFGQAGTGNGSAGFVVAANTDSPARTGTITVGSQSITISQAGQNCNFALNPASASITSAAQTGTFALSGLAGCAWTATSNTSFLQITTGASGTGPATIGYTAQANTGSAPRTGTIGIAGLTFTVTQAPACTYTLSSIAGSFTSVGGIGTITVTSGSGCAWTATAGASFIRITSGQTGSGTGTVTFAVDANPGNTRTGAIAVAGQTFTVTQTGLTCSFTLTPATTTVPTAGGTATFSVSAAASCSWTATGNVSWITIVTGASGLGAGVVGISAAANPDSAARTGTVTAGGQIFTVTQAGSQIQISFNSIANAASYAAGAVSPGLIVVIAVPGIGPSEIVLTQLTHDNLFFTTQLGDTRVLFDGIPAPMVYAASGQFGAIVPYSVFGKTSTQFQVEYKGQRSNSVPLPVVASLPGLFSIDTTGKGPGVIIDPQGVLNSASNPAPKGSVVVVYATGEGQTNDPGVDGKLAVDPFPKPILPVTVMIDGIEAEAPYFGAAPGLVAGLMQINVRIPAAARSGAIPILLKVGQFQSQTGVTVAVQ